MPAELKPPFLISRSPAGDGCVSVTADVHAGVIEVAVHGRWSPALRIEAWTAVTKCFVEHPLAVIVDLHDLGDPLATSAPAWWTMGMTGARMTPPVSVVMCLPSSAALAGRLNRLGAKRSLPVFATMPEARIAVADRLPLTQRVQLHLAPQPDAAGQARGLINDICRAWRLPQLAHPAALIITELVGNAVRHAGTDILVTVSRRGTGMHLAVNDDDPRLPELADPAPQRHGGPADDSHGLRAVHAAATVWGAMPTDKGKVVWAMVRPSPP
jgi:anti-sigma regulatory factor (Ser/Thr protein kinase)